MTQPRQSTPSTHSNSTPTPTDAIFRAIGTTVHVVVTDPDARDQATTVVRAHLRALDVAASRFHDRELIRLETGSAAGSPHPVSRLLFEILEEALLAALSTDGLVTPTVAATLQRCGYDRDFAQVPRWDPHPVRPDLHPVPDWRKIVLDGSERTVMIPRGVRLDLGATGKAGCADRAARAAAAVTGCGVLVNVGGDVSVAGRCPGGGWSVRIADTADAAPDAPSVSIAICHGGVATSGTAVRCWQRGTETLHHLIDPITGAPASSCWRTVTVAAESCLAANTASTAAFILGRAAPQWLSDRGMHARLAPESGSVVITGDWPPGAVEPQVVPIASRLLTPNP